MDYEFDRGILIEPLGPGEYSANLDGGWVVGGGVNGGYALAVIGNAIRAELTTDGQRWWIEDLQSSNGTYIGGAGEPLPTTAVAPGQRVELADDDRVYVGAWTRIVVRQA